MSWKKFLGELLKILLKIAVIFYFYIWQGRVVALLLSNNLIKSYYIAFIISFSFAALILLWYIKKEGGRHALSLKDVRWQIWIWVLLLSISQFMFFSVFGGYPILIAKSKITLVFIVYSFGVILFGPLVEEIVFRGLLQRHLSIKLSPWLAILITSVLFALVHYKSHGSVMAAFLIGIFCGFIYYKTDKLILCILYHAFYNLLVSIFQFSLKYNNILQITTLILTIGLTVYSIRELKKTSNANYEFVKNKNKKQKVFIDNSEIDDIAIDDIAIE